MGKIFEPAIAELLRKHFCRECPLSTDQCGSQAGCCMIHAAWKRKNSLHRWLRCTNLAQLLVSTSRMHSIWRQGYMLKKCNVPVHLHSNIWDYFWDQAVLAQTAFGMIRKEITYGVSQGSVFRLLLWNIAFDDILKRDILPGVIIICYTDREDDIPMLERKVNSALETVTHWIESGRLSLATMKMKVILFTCCQFSPSSFHRKGEEIRFCRALKYLGLWFDKSWLSKGIPLRQRPNVGESLRTQVNSC